MSDRRDPIVLLAREFLWKRRTCHVLREKVLTAEILVRERVWTPFRAGAQLRADGCPLHIAARVIGRAANQMIERRSA